MALSPQPCTQWLTAPWLVCFGLSSCDPVGLLSRRLYSSSLSSLAGLPAKFVDFGSARIAAGSVAGASSAGGGGGRDAAAVRALAVHPTLPVLALLLRSDEVHFYDVHPAAAASVAASNPAHLPAALQSLERTGSPAVVQGAWVQRTLRHPLMARSCSVAWAPPGGQMVAVGTETGVLCLWQLVSVPAAAAGHAPTAAAQSLGAPAGISAGVSASGASARRLGAWLHVLHHPSLAGLPLSHLCFSPCGRWLAVASRARTGFVLWDVAAALGQPGSAAGCGGAAAFIDKPLASVLEAGAGVDFLRWSPRGDALLVASSPRAAGGFAAAAAAAVARAALQGARRVWNKATGREDADAAESDEKKVEADAGADAGSAELDAAATATATVPAAKLPAGTLTVWNATSWTHESWSTASPITDASWHTGRDGPAGAPALLLLSLQGSPVVQSVAVHIPSTRADAATAVAAAASAATVPARPFASSSSTGTGGLVAAPSRAPTTSALANASIRIDCSETEGLPPSRAPSDPTAALETFRLGGAVSRLAWSASGARLAVSFAEGAAGGALVAVFALNRVAAIDTWQVLPVGVVRGPVCPCGGMLHPAQHAAGAAAAAASAAGGRRNASSRPACSDAEQDGGDREAELERKYASSPDGDSDSDAHEHKALYPSLAAAAATAAATGAAAARPCVCAAPNTPVHLSFLNSHASAGELLAISWKFGQVSFVPLYFAQA